MALARQNVPGFTGRSYEEHVDAALMLIENIQQNIWALAAVCASLQTTYGDDTVGKFASDIGRSARSVREMAQTYRAWENGARAPILGFRHHTIAARSKDPQKTIALAEAQEMSTRQLEAHVRAEKSEGDDVIEVEVEEWVDCPHCSGRGRVRRGEAIERPLDDGRDPDIDWADWLSLFFEFKGRQVTAVERLGGMERLCAEWDQETREQIVSDIEEVQRTLSSWKRTIKKDVEAGDSEPEIRTLQRERRMAEADRGLSLLRFLHLAGEEAEHYDRAGGFQDLDYEGAEDEVFILNSHMEQVLTLRKMLTTWEKQIKRELKERGA